jgi:hypothetical protein
VGLITARSGTCDTKRIEVSGPPAVHVERLRTYAEYRVFSQVAAFADPDALD